MIRARMSAVMRMAMIILVSILGWRVRVCAFVRARVPVCVCLFMCVFQYGVCGGVHTCVRMQGPLYTRMKVDWSPLAYPSP